MKNIILALFILTGCVKESAKITIDHSNDKIEILDGYRIYKGSNIVKDSIVYSFTKLTGAIAWKSYCGYDLPSAPWSTSGMPLTKGTTENEVFSAGGNYGSGVKTAPTDVHLVVNYSQTDSIVAKTFILTKFIYR